MENKLVAFHGDPDQEWEGAQRAADAHADDISAAYAYSVEDVGGSGLQNS